MTARLFRCYGSVSARLISYNSPYTHTRFNHRHPTSTYLRLLRHLSTTPSSDDDSNLTYDSLAHSAADYLQSFHEAISFDVLPWAATIPLVALSLRVITLPMVYHSQIHTGRAALAATELPRIHYFVRSSPGTLFQKYRTFRRLRALTLRSAGTSPWQQFPWHVAVHVPLLVISSMGVRAVASRGLPEWQTGGLPFAPDLLVADPSGALPVLTTALWLWNVDPRSDARRRAVVEANAHVSKRSRIVDALMTRLGEAVTTTMQVVAVVVLTFTTQLPAGLVLFWVSNAAITALQRWLFSLESVRKRIGLPTPDDIAKVQRSNLMPAIEQSVEEVRKQLSYVQQRMLQMFANRSVDDRLRTDVNRMLERERRSGRISADLEAVIRQDERDGKRYVAVIKRGSNKTI